MARFGPGNKAGVGHGRPKLPESFRRQARLAADEHVMKAWIDEVEMKEREVLTDLGPITMVCRGPNWVKAAEMLAAYGYGKPMQSVKKTVTHVRQSPRDLSLDELEKRLAEMTTH